MLSWDDLRFVLAVQRHGSLARAAKALGLNKSTVSRRIAAIEEELGTALLVRGPRGYDLTEAGRAATKTAERIESLVNELVGTIGDVDRTAAGIVNVTAPAFFAQHVIIPDLPALQRRHPGLHVHLITTDAVLNLMQREADIALRNVRPDQQSLIVRKGGDMSFGMYAASSYIAKHGMPADRESLHDHHFIAYSDAIAYVDAYRWANELSPRIVLRAHDAVSMLDAVAAGIGIGVLPSFLARTREGLRNIDTVGPPRPETIWVVSHPDCREVERIRIVADWLVQQFADKAEMLVG